LKGERASAGRLRRAGRRLRQAGERAAEDLFGRTRPGSDGLPLPPARLMRRVSGATSQLWFLFAGQAARADLEGVLERQGRRRAELGRVLDFGCGCGRVLRQLAEWTPEVELHGCDPDAAAVRWARRHLAFTRCALSGRRPPLDYGDASFGLVWALSVFTHLPADDERLWLDELRRVVRPGGLLVLTLHGAANAESLAEVERAAFARGERVTVGARRAGTNACNAFHPERAIRAELAAGWRLLEHLPAGARGNPPQDLVVLERPALR
jgi:SAM-dependent methyltransferase